MEDSLYEIRPAGIKGRGLFSLTNFSKGDIIFEEEPIISCQFAWNEDYSYKACDNCLRPLETAEENAKRLSMNDKMRLPYPEQCSVDKTKHTTCPLCNVIYCSQECQALAWNKYHKTLCLRKYENDNTHPLEILKQIWKEMYYPPETSSIMLFARIFAMIHQAEDKESILNLLQQFCSPPTGDEDLSWNLLGLKFANQLDVLREQLIKSVPVDCAPQWMTPNGFRSLIGMVGMNGQGIGTSAVSDWVKNIDKLNLEKSEKEVIDGYISKLYEEFENTVGEFLNNEGSGLYSIQSSINHSCKPNAEVAFPNSNYRLAVRCVEDIEPGEEICISYIDDCILERSRHSRQKILQTNYFFNCKCLKCEEEVHQPDETSEDDDEDEDDCD